jgi:exopolysaccharide production protein ExoZ
MGEIHSIQYLRGFAATAVVCFHISEQFNGPFAIGAAGVDVFFVISGFIMWVTTADRPADPMRFMWRRIVRIVPLYWLVTLLTAAGIFLRPHFFYGHELSPENFVGSLVFLPVLQNGALHPVVIQGWTLCYEMMFYIVFALTLLLGQKQRFGAMIGVLVAIVVLNLCLVKGYASAFASPIVLEFAAGVVVGRLWMKDIRLQLVLAFALIGGGLLLLALGQTLDPEMPRVLRWGIPAMLIVGGAVFAERARPFKPLALLTFVGEASYSIYLWHVLVAIAMTGILLRLGVPLAWQPAPLVILSLVVSALLYLAIEKPLVRLLNRSRSKKPAVSQGPVQIIPAAE